MTPSGYVETWDKAQTLINTMGYDDGPAKQQNALCLVGHESMPTHSAHRQRLMHRPTTKTSNQQPSDTSARHTGPTAGPPGGPGSPLLPGNDTAGLGGGGDALVPPIKALLTVPRGGLRDP